MSSPDTPTALLDEAEQQIRTRGFNAFSYKDLAEAVGIRTASIHYHFPSKGDLGCALIQRYLDRLEVSLAEIERRSPKVPRRLRAFVELYRKTGKDGGVCLCGSMASDITTLDEATRDGVAAYLDRSEGWVRAQIERGVQGGEFSTRTRARDLAASLVAGLQGALLLGRARGDAISALERVRRTFFASLGD